MSKTEETLSIESALIRATSKLGVYGCLEVTIGFHGKERVDYMTYDTKRVFRCYEIKVTKKDFHSSWANSFVGNYNYFVMPHWLYEEVKHEIPPEVGVYADMKCVKHPKKMPLRHSRELLLESMVRSLHRERGKEHWK